MPQSSNIIEASTRLKDLAAVVDAESPVGVTKTTLKEWAAHMHDIVEQLEASLAASEGSSPAPLNTSFLSVASGSPPRRQLDTSRSTMGDVEHTGETAGPTPRRPSVSQQGQRRPFLGGTSTKTDEDAKGKKPSDVSAGGLFADPPKGRQATITTPTVPGTAQGRSRDVVNPFQAAAAAIGSKAVPNSTLPPAKEMQRVVCGSLYMILEAVVNTTRAERGSIVLHMGASDEMVTVCTVGKAAQLPPSLCRYPNPNSLTGAVMSSGVAINIAGDKKDDDGRRSKSTLIFPIAGSPGKPNIGVLNLANKYKGACRFSEWEESVAYSGAQTISTLMQSYPIEWFNSYYDPIILHNLVPFEPHVLHESTMLAVIHSPPTQLIHRTTKPISLSKRQQLADVAAGLGPAPSLVEVDGYVSNLQECWRRGLKMNTEIRDDAEGKHKQIKQVRESLVSNRIAMKDMSEQLKFHSLDAGDYKREYTELKKELDSYLRKKRNVDVF